MAEASDSRGHPQGSPPLRTSLLTAIVTVVVLASAGCSSTSDDAADEGAAGDAIAPTTILEEASSSSAVTTTTPDEVADSAIEVVVSALDAKNSLDFDGWLILNPPVWSWVLGGVAGWRCCWMLAGEGRCWGESNRVRRDLAGW
jgi:hypothetical protein